MGILYSMGKLKRFAEEISVAMDRGGKIDDQVLDYAQQRLRMNHISSLIKKYREEEKEKKLNDNKSRTKQN